MVNSIHRNTINTKILLFTIIDNLTNHGLQLQETKIPDTMALDHRACLGTTLLITQY